MIWIDSNIPKEIEFTPNNDWSVNKKGYRQRIISQRYEPEHNDEIWLLFKLSRTVWIQEIQVGFTSFWTSGSEVYIKPSCVIFEAGISENETLWTYTLDRIDDKGSSNFGVTVYGACWLSFLNKASSDETNTLI